MANSSMPWVKLYTEFLDDTKIRRLTRSARLTFTQLLLIAGECDADGMLVNGDDALSLDDVAWRVREPIELITADINDLVAAGLVATDDGMLSVTNFSKRQGRSQSEKREKWRARKQKQREKDAPKDEGVTRDSLCDSNVTPESVTRDSLCDSNVTPESVTLQRRVEESREDSSDASASRVVAITETSNTTITQTHLQEGEMSETKLDPLAHAFEWAARNSKEARMIRGWKLAQHIEDMCLAFQATTGVDVIKDDRGKWAAGARDLNELSATKDELAAVWRDRGKLSLTHPGAMVEMVKALRVNRPQAVAPSADLEPVRLANGDIVYRETQCPA